MYGSRNAQRKRHSTQMRDYMHRRKAHERDRSISIHVILKLINYLIALNSSWNSCIYMLLSVWVFTTCIISNVHGQLYYQACSTMLLSICLVKENSAQWRLQKWSDNSHPIDTIENDIVRQLSQGGSGSRGDWRSCNSSTTKRCYFNCMFYEVLTWDPLVALM